jgi:hypothetical protein
MLLLAKYSRHLVYLTSQSQRKKSHNLQTDTCIFNNEICKVTKITNFSLHNLINTGYHQNIILTT